MNRDSQDSESMLFLQNNPYFNRMTFLSFLSPNAFSFISCFGLFVLQMKLAMNALNTRRGSSVFMQQQQMA